MKGWCIGMQFAVLFFCFVVVYIVFGWLIEKSTLHNKLVNKLNKYKHFKLILSLILFVFGFLVEYVRQSLNEIYGQENITRIILGAILFSIYAKFIPFIFAKNKLE